jgi:hypothetical protein
MLALLLTILHFSLVLFDGYMAGKYIKEKKYEIAGIYIALGLILLTPLFGR